MKKFILILAAALFLAAGCQKAENPQEESTVPQLELGVYSARTPDGDLIVQLIDGTSCSFSFQNYPAMYGSYKVSGTDITLMGYAYTAGNKMYAFGRSWHGTITSGTTFEIEAEVFLERLLCKFTKLK